MRNPSTPRKPAPTLEDQSNRLVYLAQLMSTGTETPDEADRFYRLLDDVLNLPPHLESEVTSTAMGLLLDLGDQDTARWLADELEVECQLYYTLDAAGREHACLTFALPVVVPSGDMVQQHAWDEDLFDELHDILAEADVVNQAAQFGIIPRLFSYEELFAKSYGQLRTLTRELSAQVMVGHENLRLPESFETGALSGASCSPYADLYYLVGLAATRSSELPDIFPPLPEERDEADNSGHLGYTDDGDVRPMVMGETGETGEGEYWEKPFCRAFDDAFGSILGSLTVLPPDGLAEDLRRGMELAREVGLLRMFELNGHDLPTEPGAADGDQNSQRLYRMGPLQDKDGELFVELSCVETPGGDALETLLWPVLLHETEEESFSKLWGSLEDAGLESEFPMASQHNLLSSVRLN